MNDFTFQDFPATVKKSSSSKKLIPIVVVLFLIGAILIGGGAYLNSQSIDEDVSPTPTPVRTVIEITNTPTPTENLSPTASETTTPSPSPKASVTKAASLTVDVLNGSGESGVAKKAADILTAAGYTIGKTRNADKFDYQGVTIQIKSGKRSELTRLKETLAKSYTIESTSADLSGSQTADAVVIIGKE
jgi:hypothetical protein